MRTAILVKLAYLRTIVVREQILSLNQTQSVRETFMICFRKTNVLVIVLSLKIWRVAIEKRLRSVILVDELFEVLVFDNNFLESRTGVGY